MTSAVFTLVLAGLVGDPDGPTIRRESGPAGATAAIVVEGLPPRPDVDWPGLFTVVVAPGVGEVDRPAMLGRYQRIEGGVRFTPRFGFDPGRTYRVRVRISRLGLGPADLPDRTLDFTDARPDRPAPTVVGVAPTADRLPENVLRFYLGFSRPMSRGEAARRVRLVHAEDDRPVESAFLNPPAELWDPTGTRLTLLIDPGRIKRGLRPREEFGPVIEAGRSYALTVDAGWPDADGIPLAAGFRKAFRAVAADDVQPDPATWRIEAPRAGTRDPLVVTFPEPLDAAQLDHALTVVAPTGQAVEGVSTVADGETRWSITPRDPWRGGPHQFEADRDLEDRAGNSIARPFEVDVQRDTPSQPEVRSTRIPVAIRP